MGSVFRLVPCLGLVVVLLVGGCASPDYREHRAAPPVACPSPVVQVSVPPPQDPRLENLSSVPLLRLRGDGYARGYLYGHQLAGKWRDTTDRLEAHAVGLAREYCPPKFISQWFVRQYTAHVAQQFSADRRFPDEAYVTPEERAYVQGIADGAGIEAASVQRMIAMVMLSDASCSAFVAFGNATEDGRLLQMRNLDWGDDELGTARETVLLVHEPPGELRYLSIGFVGLVGSISGINEAGISLSEIGADSSDRRLRGTPMPFLLERVLAQARTLDQAVELLRDVTTTGGYNFMVGSARERRGAVVERTAQHAGVYYISSENYADDPNYFGFDGFDCRAAPAAHPAIRRFQNCNRGEDGSPVGQPAYEDRYRKQIELFEQWGRKLDLDRAVQLTEAVAPKDNVHSILYDFDRGRVYLRNRAWFRDGRTNASEAERMLLRAAAQPPVVVDLGAVFPTAPARSTRGTAGSGSPRTPR